jgi:predicted MFS family arabinose efflux permease
VRGRIAAALAFVSYGVILGTWTSQVSAVKRGLDLSDGQLSLALLGFAAGAITGMQFVGRIVDRYGSAAVMIPMVLVDGFLLVGPAWAGNLPLLVLALFAFGAAHGTVNIAMNANAVVVERAHRSPIMSSFHAAYSIGGFLGAAIGGLFASAGLGTRVTFAAVAALIVVSGLVSWRLAYDEPPGARLSGSSVDGRIGQAGRGSRMVHKGRLVGPGIYFLGLLAFCCLVGEGAAADWSTVYVRDTLGSGPGFAASAYAAFSIMMMVGRLAGDRLATRFGAVRLVRACGVLAAVSLGLALIVNQPIAGVIGFGLFGAGLSCIAPLVFSAAGARDPDRAGQAIARVASLGWIGFLIGPIVIGGAAELVGLSWALSIPVLLAGFVALTATAVRPRPIVDASPIPTR